MRESPTSCLTLTSDASWDPETGIAAWAFQAVSDGFRHRAAGTFKTALESSHRAEVCAIGNAAHLLNKLRPQPVRLVVINVDCKSAMLRLADPRQDFERYVLHHLAQLMVTLGGARYELRWVKAHTTGRRGQRAREVVNNQCDKAARAELRKALRERAKYEQPF